MATTIHLLDGSTVEINPFQIVTRKEQSLGSTTFYSYVFTTGDIINSTDFVTIPTPGSGTVTSITAGNGLTGGTITTAGTIAVDGTKFAKVNGHAVFDAEDFIVYTFSPMPEPPSTVTNLNQLCSWLVNDIGMLAGQAFLGATTLGPLPSGVGNAEIRIYCNFPGLLVLELTSTNVPPYHWIAQYWGGSLNIYNDGPWLGQACIFDGNSGDSRLTWSSNKIKEYVAEAIAEHVRQYHG